ncbi:PRKG1_interact domain-containing protein [Nephila pilipes]|uniref:PRKG1_interact domain-containing protein n=1 Tax=Nephila pilipes TaxID=299642 RepID=A0A8X6QKN3_NEPPI|nr:PRKG1_interact domain-containing protein [Nephila pilipes]
MSYGSYGRYGSGYSSYSGSNRRLGSSSYLPSSYSPRRTSGGSYGLTPSYSSSYLSPNSSPRSSISSGSTREVRPSYGSFKTLTGDSRRDYSPEQTGYKLTSSKSASSLRSDDGSDQSSLYEGHSERPRQRYGSSTSIPDTSFETSYRSDTPSSRYGSKTSLSEDENKDYKKLYEDLKKENERLKDTLQKTEEELEKAKKQLQKLSQSSTIKNSVSEAEKKERRSLERKLSEMEEEIKQNERLRADNDRLREENAALIRVISKISQ